MTSARCTLTAVHLVDCTTDNKIRFWIDSHNVCDGVVRRERAEETPFEPYCSTCLYAIMAVCNVLYVKREGQEERGG
jgi:hypothetical protein